MRGKICLVTGANSGLGRATTEELSRRGARVVMVCRDRGRGVAAKAAIERRIAGADLELIIADLASLSDVRRLSADFLRAHSGLDVLINNAGVIQGVREVTEDGYEATFAINHLAHFLLTHLLLGPLSAREGARIINVSSDAHRSAGLDFDDLHSETRYRGFRAYANSKLANVLFTVELARRLASTGVTANALHPGIVRTGIGRRMPIGLKIFFTLAGPALLSPRRGARTAIHLATSPYVEGVSGEYFVKERRRAPSPAAQNRELATKLWEISEELAGI